MQFDNPNLYDTLEPVIKVYGYESKFQDLMYRYWDHADYRYCIVNTSDDIPSGNASINRTHKDAERL